MRPWPLCFPFLTACLAGGELPGGTIDEGPEALPTSWPDPARSFWEAEGAVRVDIELPAATWDVIRYEGRTWVDVLSGDCLAEPFESPYHWYEADIEVDGLAVEGVGLRKKGFLGSLSESRPSLKVALDEFDDLEPIHGLTRFALNNGAQDPALLRTCVGFRGFADLGVPAPRCRIALVTVNGQNLGPYAIIEDIDDSFLGRSFGEDGGTLWEGTLSDFRDGWLGTFDPDTNANEADPERLDAVREALARPDGEGLAPIEAVVDLPAFLRFWAAEVLLGHWDGYNANTNNFFVYAPAEGGGLRFLPWGPDAVLPNHEPFGEGVPVAAVATSALAHRLLSLPEGRRAYEDTLRSLVSDRWRAEDVVDRIESFADLAEPAIPEEFQEGWRDEIARLTEVAEERAERVIDELDDGLTDELPPLREAVCLEEVGSIDGSFEATWGTLEAQEPWGEGTLDLGLRWGGAPIDLVRETALVGEPSDGPGWGRFVGLVEFGGSAFGALIVQAPLEQWVPGTTFSSSDPWAYANLLYLDETTGGEWVQSAFLDEVRFSLDEVGTTPGDTVRGTFEATALGWGG